MARSADRSRWRRSRCSPDARAQLRTEPARGAGRPGDALRRADGEAGRIGCPGRRGRRRHGSSPACGRQRRRRAPGRPLRHSSVASRLARRDTLVEIHVARGLAPGRQNPGSIARWAGAARRVRPRLEHDRALAACSLLADSDGLSDHYGESTGDAATSGGDGAAGSSDGDGAAGSSDGEAPKPCSGEDHEISSPVMTSTAPRQASSVLAATDGAGSIEVTSARAFGSFFAACRRGRRRRARPAIREVLRGPRRGRRDDEALRRRADLGAGAPHDLRSASGKRLSLVLVGLNLAFAVGCRRTEDSIRIYPSTIDVSAGAWSPVNVDISDLNATRTSTSALVSAARVSRHRRSSPSRPRSPSARRQTPPRRTSTSTTSSSRSDRGALRTEGPC